MVYIYDSHLDGFYTNNKKLDDDFLYCETCGVSDYLIDSIRNNPTFNELKNLFYKEKCGKPTPLGVGWIAI